MSKRRQNPGCVEKKWGSDRLGRNPRVNGASRKFKFGDTKHCVQDIKVVFTDDSS
ncbi:hypothetical protein [Acidovorax sp. SUPP3334]|uniref:hypothetical protein n=1 Tax=Acidovorax sp. SUPP3334 TaxID=2920881 RepID=UPI0023DE6771|nr:hypothetical protein [Acidovorax sp. SUPP3334]GKT21456.1 hypothetical protein AVHM3334_04840 [Acidovorax sp. SUPP3334]